MKKDWQTKRLRDVCEIIKGRKPVLKATASNGDLPYLVAKVMRGSAEAEFASVKDRNSITVEESETIIICDGSNSGEVFTGFRGILSSTMGKISKKTKVHNGFLRAFLTSTFEVFNGAKTGAAIPHLDKEAMYQLEFPLPPLSEQKRIVELLDEAFENIATAKANAEKNLKNSCALFESHLQSIFTQRGKGWVEKRLGDIVEFKNGLNFTRQSNGQTLRIVGVGDFQDHSIVPIEALQSVTIDGELGDDYLIRRNDILTVRSNGSRDLVGRCMLVPDVNEVTSFSGFIIRLRYDSREINPRFLLHLMKSSETRDRLTRDGGGANISNINQAKLSELPISLPSFKQQKDIADRLDGLHEETERLANLYERKIAALDALKKSLLHQAFTGELTKEFSSIIIPFPATVPNITPTDLHAGILAIGYEIHEKAGRLQFYGHVKAEKISHMMEALVGIDLGRFPMQDAAGPNDFPHLKRVEHRARMAGFFNFREQAGGRYKMIKGRNFNTLINKVRTVLGELNPKVDNLIKLMLPLDMQQAEVFATVHAAWNNLLMEGHSPTDEQIVLAARENWHPDKLNIPRDKFFKTIDWIRKKNIYPEGKGKKVAARAG